MEQDSFKLGVQAARSGEYQQAQRYFIQVVQANPNSEKGWLYLGHCLTEPPKKEACYQKVLQLNPSNQEAQKALSALKQSNQPQEIDPDSGKRQPALAQSQSVEKAGQTPPARTTKSIKRSRNPKLLLIGLGTSLVVCLGVLFVAFAGMSTTGQALFHIPAGLLLFAPATSTMTPVPTITHTPTFTQTATITQTPRPSMTPLASALPSATYIFDDSFGLEALNTPEGGIPLDATSPAQPKTANDYYTRALVDSSASAIGSEYIYQQKMMDAIDNINAAIALRSDFGNYYALRQRIYYTLGGLELYSVDRQVFYQLALADAYQENSLGTTIEPNPERVVIVDLITTNQCDLALDETQKLMDKTPKTQSQYGGLLSLQSRAFSCLGRLDEAIQAIRDSMFNAQNIDTKTELEAIFLLQAGRNDEALSAINKVMAHCTCGGGYRRFLRAEVYYAKGQKDLARQDIFTGIPNTWLRGGFLPYVQAQFALDEGKKQEAIVLLQLAEASFDPIYNPFRLKIQKQLARLGAGPSAPTPSVSLTETPSP